jgi:putative PIN family toxin of toxin-antitoxin system
MSIALGAEHLKAVLDTNLYIASFEFPKGRTAALWHAAAAGRYHLLVSPAIIQEMAGVLRLKFGWPEERVQSAVRAVAHAAGNGIIVPRVRVRALTADPDDNRILECAIEGKADIIVSNDHHLLDLKTWSGIPIVAGVDFRRTLGLK